MTDHYALAVRFADQVHRDTRTLAEEYAKPPLDLLAVPAMEPGQYANRDTINQLQGRVGRQMKRAETHALLAISQRLDDLINTLEAKLS